MNDAATKPPTFKRDWFTRAIPLFESLLSPLAGRPGLRALEIGSFEGRSAYWLLDNILTAPDAELYCLDVWDGHGDSRYRNQNSELYVGDSFRTFWENILGHPTFGMKVRPRRGLSFDSLASIAAMKGIGRAIEFDFIYVDGSHQGTDVLADAVLSWRLLKKGGIIIFDDYDYELAKRYPSGEGHRLTAMEPAIALNGFLATHGKELTILHREYQLALRKEI
ncbi:MAG: hypothetical protein MOGMAGMI_01966 [Candidatus Omnitrophica bacterium]|nr:hypothetical protein [Candidatus Omnitrophota bacterium]